LTGWIRVALGGLAVGMAIMEGFDTSAILSLYIAAFVLFQTWISTANPKRALARGVGRVALVALCAAFISASALSTLIGTQIQGVAGMQQDTSTREQRWDEATMWSLPKVETLRVVIPGLFGYRMDTPDGGNYWGSVGQRPGVPESRRSGVYAGVLVVLIAGWAMARSFRRNGSPFTEQERKFIWFWAGAALVSLLLAYGRHAPLYQLIYQLPYFSTIRNPIKFMHPFTVALVILFAYGLEGLSRCYLEGFRVKAGSLAAQMKAWWTKAPGFERKWGSGSLAVFGVGVLGWLVYASSRSELERHMQSVGFPAELAATMARFSIVEVGWFVLFLGMGVGVLILIASGVLAGPRAKWAWTLLSLLLLTDLVRANSPWIIYYNYKEKYALNPVLDRLRMDPHERRVAARLGPMSGNYLASDQARLLLGGMAEEWLQHHYQYYKIQALDIIQMPRMPEADLAFLRAILSGETNQLAALGRLWQLTNTRYILGMTGFLDLLNQQIDPLEQSFRVHTAFDFAPRHSAATATRAEDITAVLRPEGNFAIFEFGAALPRAQLFTTWQVIEDDSSMLRRLADPALNPGQTVLVSDPLPAPDASPAPATGTGTVRIIQYEPKRVVIEADNQAPSVLLLNDKFDPNWQVTVNGQPAALLRCNYIMRGVYLEPGTHQVEFRFKPPYWTLYVSLAGIALGSLLCGILAVKPKVASEPAATPIQV
jgi:hypothetical protein